MTQLKSATLILNNETVEVIAINNPCQMWKQVYSWFDKYGDGLRVIVPEADGTPFKDFTAHRRSDGKRVLINSVKETNRGYIKAHRTAAPEIDPLDRLADQAVENDNLDMTFPIDKKVKTLLDKKNKAYIKSHKDATKPTEQAEPAEPAESAEPAEQA